MLKVRLFPRTSTSSSGELAKGEKARLSGVPRVPLQLPRAVAVCSLCMAHRNGFSPKSSDQSPLVNAATSLESELEALESISRATRKIPLNSEKNIARAARELQQALTLPERLAAGLQQLAVAMAGVQERQQAVIEPLA